MQAWPGKVFDDVRFQQLKEIKNFVNKLKNSEIIRKEEPLIYQGDFNIDYYRYKTSLLKMCNITLFRFLGRDTRKYK